ncbi:MAG TPA: DNA polymerase III subunit beta, partial [Bacteroidales bacterium]
IDFPQVPTVKDDKKTSLRLNYDVLMNGINKTLFATADDELRPVMNGIFVELTSKSLTFVASDAHKLVRYRRNDIKPGTDASFILPKKPASLLKNILPKETADISIEFDDKNAVFTLTNFTLVSRLVEGNYPSYNSVIPTDNPNTLTIDRLELYNSLRRVSVFANQASNLVKMAITGNELTVSAQDLDFSISAYERLNCQYEGDDLEIGFKSLFLVEILSNLSSGDVIFGLSDPSRAGIMVPAQSEVEGEDILMLLMPMMINI